ASFGDLCGGVAQDWAGFVDVDFPAFDRSALAFVGVVDQASPDPDGGAFAEGGRDVFGVGAPDGAVEEDGGAVFPFAGVAVFAAGGDCDAEVGDGDAGVEVGQVGVFGA